MSDSVTDGFSPFQKTTLANGLRVVTSTMPHTRSVTVGVYVGVGSRYESLDTAGVSHFLEHLLFKGTPRRPTPKDISSQVEGVGGVMNAGTERELTVYWVRVAKNHLTESLDLLLDMLRNSLYDPEEMEKERLVILDELAMVTDQPDSRMDTVLDEMLWPNHPLGQEIGGTKQSIMNITRDALIDHASRFYAPDNVVISVAGAVEHSSVVDQVATLASDWTGSAIAGWDTFSDQQNGAELRVEFQKTDQTYLSMGFPGFSLTHPDTYALDLFNLILGEGMSSRLFLELREKLGIAYDVHSWVSHYQDCGAVVVSAGVQPKRVQEAVEAILYELGQMKIGISEEELEKAKNMAMGRLFLRMEETRNVSAWMGLQETLIGTILDVDAVASRISAVTSDDLLRVGNELIVTEKSNLVVIGPHRSGRRLRTLLDKSFLGQE